MAHEALQVPANASKGEFSGPPPARRKPNRLFGRFFGQTFETEEHDLPRMKRRHSK